jgi:predicted NAD/FAD-binding protein
MPMTSGDQVGSARPSVAVIGAGVAGLTAAYLLQRRYDVTLFEAEGRLGGHAHTHDVDTPDAGVIPVDSGFIVHNNQTYPNLIRLFKELGVATQPSEMSMSIRCEGCGLEYAGARGLRGVFAQSRTLVRGRFWRMLVEVDRFHRQARRVVHTVDDQTSLADFLRDGGFSKYFTSHFMIPMVSAVWSAAPDTALQYPARYLFEFLANHGLLSVRGSHQWMTVKGGSRTYVDAVASHLVGTRLSTPVRAVKAGPQSVDLRLDSDQVSTFDRAVLATHPDTALALLDGPTEAQRRTLGAFAYSRNETVLHSDPSVLPRSRHAAAAWNYVLPTCDAASDSVLVSYNMNRLQRLPTEVPHIVTLNATDRIDPAKVIAEMVYQHPIYTRDSVSAQADLSRLNDGTLAFAGAYHGWGFHEDGCRAGGAAARSLGVDW